MARPDKYRNYFDHWRARVVRARKPWPCVNCGGTIPQGAEYLNIDPRQPGARWDRRMHLDCLLPWYVVPGEHRCRNIGDLPGRLPPPEERDERLEDLPLAFHFADDLVGEIILRLNSGRQERFLQAPDIKVRKRAQLEFEMALGLLLRAFGDSIGNRKRARLLSNFLAELEQRFELTPERPPELSREEAE